MWKQVQTIQRLLSDDTKTVEMGFIGGRNAVSTKKKRVEMQEGGEAIRLSKGKDKKVEMGQEEASGGI